METEIVHAAPSVPIPADFTAAERAEATRTREALEAEFAQASEHYRKLRTSAIKIGNWLNMVGERGWYRLYGHAKISDYFDAACAKYGLKRSTLYGYRGTVEQLCPYVPLRDLEKIGIEKAKVMARAARVSGRIVDAEVIELAKLPGTRVEDVRAKLEEKKLLSKGEKPKGSWFDVGFFVTTDERQEINRFFEVARRTDGVGVDKQDPEWRQQKACILAAMREFLSTYGVES